MERAKLIDEDNLFCVQFVKEFQGPVTQEEMSRPINKRSMFSSYLVVDKPTRKDSSLVDFSKMAAKAIFSLEQ
jgi:hypothetical protein